MNEYYNKGRKLPEDKDEKTKAETAKSTEAAGKIIYNGFIAQEVEEAAKKLDFSFSGVDKPQSEGGLYGLRYDNFVAPLVKAVQELSKQNEELKNKDSEKDVRIDDLQKQINALKALITDPQTKVALTLNNVTLTDASLEQNVPNPFNNTTNISYTLPQRFTNAQILITDKSGKLLKQVNVSGAGRGTLNVNATTLSSGAYNYSLIVNGKTIDSKQMVLTR